MARSPGGGTSGAAAPGCVSPTELATSPTTCGSERPVADETVADETATEETAAPPEAPTLHGCPVVTERGQQIVHCGPDQYLDLISTLKSDGYTFCSDL